MTAYNSFKIAMTEALETLETERHNFSYCAHLMEMDPSEPNIRAYENAIQREKAARETIGDINRAELAARARDAGLPA